MTFEGLVNSPVEPPITPTDLLPELPSIGLVFCHYNVCHLSNKLEEINLLLSSVARRRLGRPNLVLGISESFLDNSWPNAALAVENYNLFRADRPVGSGGGLLIYVPSQLPVKRRSDLELEGIECIWLELHFPRSRPCLICFVYRPPSSNPAYTTLLEDMLSHSDSQGLQTIIIGDLNFDLLETPRPCPTKHFGFFQASFSQLHKLR